jgi:hypothetical protein
VEKSAIGIRFCYNLKLIEREYSSISKRASMKHNYIFIDYENIQPANLEILNRPDISVIVFVGSQQTKIPIDFAIKMQSMGERAQYIKVTKSANNALDFYIAFYMGKILAHHPNARSYIISKDTGYQPLISHLKEQGISAALCEQIEQLPPLKSVKTRPLQPNPEPKQQVSQAVSLQQSAPPKKTNGLVSPQTSMAGEASSSHSTLSVDTLVEAPRVVKPIPTKQSEQIQVILGHLGRQQSRPRTQQALTNHIFALFRREVPLDQVTKLISVLVKQKHITLNNTQIIYHIELKKEAA